MSIQTKRPPERHAVLPGIPEELERFRDKKVYFAIPTRGNDIYWGQVQFLISQFKIFENAALFYGVSGHKCAIEHMLERLTTRPFDYVYFMDADIGPLPLTTLKLLSREVDVVQSPVWMYDPDQNDIHLNYHPVRDGEVLWRHHAPKDNEGLKPIVSGSMASVLISKKVLDAFKNAGESFTTWTPFLDEKLSDMPADVVFWAKVCKFGFKLYIDWDVEFATHHRLVELCPDSLNYYLQARAIETLYPNGEQKKIGQLANA